MDKTKQTTFLNGFVETQTYEEISNAVKLGMAVNHGFVIAAFGNPGFGKTHALLKIASEYQRSIYLEISQVTKKHGGLYSALLTKLGACDPRNNYEKRRLIVDCLKTFEPVFNDPFRYILIIDEAQTLEMAVQRDLLAIKKETGCCLLLAGNNERLASDSGKKGNHVLMEQIEGRVNWWCNINPPTEQDCQKLVDTFDIADKSAREACIKIGRQSNLRILSDILDIAKTLNGDDSPISLPALRLATSGKMKPAPQNQKILKLLGVKR